jgi:hypothetical protein
MISIVTARTHFQSGKRVAHSYGRQMGAGDLFHCSFIERQVGGVEDRLK